MLLSQYRGVIPYRSIKNLFNPSWQVHENETMVFEHYCVLGRRRPRPSTTARATTLPSSYTPPLLKLRRQSSRLGITIPMTRRRSCSCTSIINHKIASAVTPNKELKGFREVFLCAGEKRACIPINVTELGSGIRTTGTMSRRASLSLRP